MASYDLQTVTGVECVQFDGADATEVIAMCPGALLHGTLEQVVEIPVGNNAYTDLHATDWLTTVATGEYVVLHDATFQVLFTASA